MVIVVSYSLVLYAIKRSNISLTHCRRDCDTCDMYILSLNLLVYKYFYYSNQHTRNKALYYSFLAIGRLVVCCREPTMSSMTREDFHQLIEWNGIIRLGELTV